MSMLIRICIDFIIQNMVKFVVILFILVLGTYGFNQFKSMEVRKDRLKLGMDRAISQFSSKYPMASVPNGYEAFIPWAEFHLAKLDRDIKTAEAEISWWERSWFLGKKDKARLAHLKAKKKVLEQALANAKRYHSFVEGDAFSLFVGKVKHHSRTAGYIILFVILTPVFIRLACYYVIAPIAKRCEPISFTQKVGKIDVPDSSSTSICLKIAAYQEAIIQSDYLQTSTADSKKDTQYFLNPRFPFSSIASGMYFLTRIRGVEATGITVSPTNEKDVNIELGKVKIPKESALVIFPHALVGVLKSREDEIQIQSIWRFRHLSAWLTLQFRYFVFHGPCTVIMKGCRGIKFEKVSKGGQIANQDATIGFTPDLSYSVIRCETFISYLRGKERLFNDHFYGNSGFFILETVPRNQNRTSGLKGRIEGVLDSLLKVFGI